MILTKTANRIKINYAGKSGMLSKITYLHWHIYGDILLSIYSGFIPFASYTFGAT